MNHKLIFLVSTFSILQNIFAATVEVRFDEIPLLVKSNNQHAQGAMLMQKSAEAGQGHLFRSYLPAISARVGQEKFKTGTQKTRNEPFGELKAEVNLFRGGRDLLEADLADKNATFAKLEAENILRQEIKKARMSYWNLVAQRELIKTLEETLSENQINVKAAIKRIQSGVATQTDQIEFEMHRIEIEQDLARLKLASEITERNLAVLLGVNAETSIKTPNVISHVHKDEVLMKNYDLKNTPVIEALSIRSQEAELEAVQLGRWWTPEVDLFGSYGLHTFREREFESQKERYESVVGIQLSMELFDGLVSRSQKRQKVLQIAGFKKDAEQTTRELHSKIEGARAELKLNHGLIHQSEEAVKKAKTYFSRTLDEYRRGVKNSPDVLSAIERNLSIQRRSTELRRDYQIARSELLEIIGE